MKVYRKQGDPEPLETEMTLLRYVGEGGTIVISAYHPATKQQVFFELTPTENERLYDFMTRPKASDVIARPKR